MGSGESIFIKDLSDINQGFDEAECRKIFDTFDKGKTGYLSKDTAIKFLTKYAKVKKVANPKQFAENTFQRLDKNKDGRLGFDELLKQRQATATTTTTTPTKQAPETKVQSSPPTKTQASTPTTTPAPNSAVTATKTEAAPQFVAASAADVFAAMVKDTEQAGGDVLLGDSLDKFFSAVNISSDGIMTLGISWKFECKTMGEISKTEFTKGCDKARCKTVDDIRRLVESTGNTLKAENQFKLFYMWVFDFAKEGEERKTLDAETACDMWGLVLVHHFALLPKWLKFFQDSKTATVTKDIWAQLAEFAFQVKGGLQNWQDDGSWPVVIDEFAQHCQSNR